MIDELFKNQLIKLDDLIILNYKKLKISEQEAMVLLLIVKFERMHISPITLNTLQEYTYFNTTQLDKMVLMMMNKKLLALDGYSISTKPLLETVKALYNKTETEPKKEVKAINLVDLFQKEFNRSLSPMEIETLKAWKQCQYSDEMIVKALKEATLSNVKNLRYIEKILVDWAKYGIKTSGREQVSDSGKTIELSNYHWWEED